MIFPALACLLPNALPVALLLAVPLLAPVDMLVSGQSPGPPPPLELSVLALSDHCYLCSSWFLGGQLIRATFCSFSMTVDTVRVKYCLPLTVLAKACFCCDTRECSVSRGIYFSMDSIERTNGILNVAELGRRVAFARKREGLSRNMLAKLVGYSEPGLFKIESGAAEPRLSVLLAIASVTEVPFAFFVPQAKLTIGDTLQEFASKISALAAEIPNQMQELDSEFRRMESREPQVNPRRPT